MLEIRTYSPTDSRFLAIVNRGEELDAVLGARVAEIIDAVRKGGADALLSFIRRFDAELPNFEAVRVTREEMERAEREVAADFLAAVRQAEDNIRRFHAHQVRKGYRHDDGDGVNLARQVLPIARIGVYCPARAAPLFSSLLMNVVPARLAEVEEIAVAIPPHQDGSVSPHMLATARYLGLDEIYKMGGSHAIAAFAYGAGPIRKVDKIVGPGNAYVAAAKRQVFGAVGIDSLAGPSEIAIIADSGADPAFIAADLLSQAEHGSGYESGVVLTNDPGLAAQVGEEAKARIARLERGEAIRTALSRYGAVFLCRDLAEAVEAANLIAPEHLEIHTRAPRELLGKIVNAGAVFLGPWSSEPVGDYFAGTNHVLPTAGAARFSSGLGVADFQKEMSVIEYSAERLRRTGKSIILMAETEGLAAHADAVKVRLERLKVP